MQNFNKDALHEVVRLIMRHLEAVLFPAGIPSGNYLKPISDRWSAAQKNEMLYTSKEVADRLKAS